MSPRTAKASRGGEDLEFRGYEAGGRTLNPTFTPQNLLFQGVYYKNKTLMRNPKQAG